jgi:hypothetical protein
MLAIKIYAHISKYLRISKMFAHTQNICAHLEISAHIQNVCLHLKYLRRSKISAPLLKYLGLIIYDRNKAAIEISAPYEKYMHPENRRPNSYYLGSAESPTSDFF